MAPCRQVRPSGARLGAHRVRSTHRKIKKTKKREEEIKEYKETFYRDDNKAGMFCPSTKRKEEEVVGGELNDERSRKGGRRDHLLLDPVIGAAVLECLLFADSVSSQSG